LIEPYEVAGQRLYHLDLYRLGDPEELEFLGLRDLLDGEALLLVEWPERGAGVLPGDPELIIDIAHAPPGRRIRFMPGAGWETLFRQAPC
jgi:tRNA threonylcarbamoyladenosine biosynthesis protein TsaE